MSKLFTPEPAEVANQGLTSDSWGNNHHTYEAVEEDAFNQVKEIIVMQ